MSTFDVILHPTDFSAESDQAFLLACSIARDQFAELVVVHVIHPSSVSDCCSDENLMDHHLPIVQECQSRFQKMRGLARDIPLAFRISLGYSVGTIMNVAREENADLIVIASHQHSLFHLQLHGSVADGVLRQSDCPVLCLRHPHRADHSVVSKTSQQADALR